MKVGKKTFSIAIFIAFFAVALLSFSPAAKAARVKDIANFRGVRSNQLIGYGLVVAWMEPGIAQHLMSCAEV